MLTVIPAGAAATPHYPAHRALDRLTSALIELQQARRRLGSEVSPETHDGLRRIEQEIRAATEILHAARGTLKALRPGDCSCDPSPRN